MGVLVDEGGRSVGLHSERESRIWEKEERVRWFVRREKKGRARKRTCQGGEEELKRRTNRSRWELPLRCGERKRAGGKKDERENS